MGTPDFASPSLNSLINSSDFDVISVYTQPDKPTGRKQILTPPPIKVLAQKVDILVYQPIKIKTETENIKNLTPDLIVVVAYGQIIPQEILDIPTYGCINIHGSLLPKYRGSACLQAPILNGDKETGVTIMQMDAGLDTGPIIKQIKIELQGTESLSDLHDRLSQLGADNIKETLLSYCRGEIEIKAQNNDQANYVSLIKKDDGHINPKKEAFYCERQVRAYHPWPGAYLLLPNGEHLKIITAKIADGSAGKTIGEIYSQEGGIYLSCGQNSLHILKLQRENRNALDASDFLKGNQDIISLIAT